MGEIVIEEVNHKAIVMTLANLFLLIASFAILAYGLAGHRLRYSFPGFLATVVFLVCFISSVVKAMKIKSLITIALDGITDNSSIGGVGYISFDDIKEFLIVTIYNREAIAVIPKNIDDFLSKYSGMKRRLIKKNIQQNLPPVAIYVDMAKDMEPEDILSLLEKRLSDYSSLYE